MSLNHIKKITTFMIMASITSLTMFVSPVMAEDVIPTGSAGDREYEAEFDYEEYNITYDLKGGHVPAGKTNKTKYTIKTPMFTLVNPEREGYTFVGWSGGYSGDDEEEDGDHYVSDEEVSLENLEDYHDGNPYKITVTLNKGVTEETTDEELETMSYRLISEGDRHYTAHWFKNSYEVTVVKGVGIDEVTGSGIYPFENEVTVGCTPSTGYEFDSWTSDEVTVANNKFNTPATNTTVTANGRLITYTITYNLAGGVASNPANYTITSENITLNNPTKTGYTFTGWTGSNGDTPEMEVTIPTGSIENREYTANWSANTYTIKYEKNKPEAAPTEVDGVTEDSVHTYDVAKELNENKYILRGYTLKEWNSQADGLGTSYADKEEVLNLTTTNEDVLTLYAIWQIDEYEVSFDMNGHGAEPAVQRREYYTQAQRPATDPTEEKWTFNGWYKEKACVNEFDFSDPIMSDTTIYARWSRTVDDVKQGAGGEGIHLEITAGGQKYDTVFSLKGGNGAPVKGECESHPLPPNVQYLKEVVKGGINTTDEATSIARTEIKDAGGNIVFKLAKIIEDEKPSNSSEATLEWNRLIPAVRYDINGGTGNIDDLLLVNDAGEEIEKELFDNDAEQPVISKTGYRFMGWNTKWNGTGTAYNTGEVITPDTVRAECASQGTKILHLYAIWVKD